MHGRARVGASDSEPDSDSADEEEERIRARLKALALKDPDYCRDGPTRCARCAPAYDRSIAVHRQPMSRCPIVCRPTVFDSAVQSVPTATPALARPASASNDYRVCTVLHYLRRAEQIARSVTLITAEYRIIDPSVADYALARVSID